MRIRFSRKQGSGRSASTGPIRAGYTFGEVLMATGILGFMGLSLYSAFASGFYVIQSTRENLRATQIMVQKTEAVRLLTWSQVNNTNKYLRPTFTEDYDPLGATNGSGGVKYTGTISASTPAVGELPEAYRTNMRTILVTVYWTNYNGTKPIVHRREMETRVARNGMQNYIWGGGL